MPPRAPSCGDWRRRICEGSPRIIAIRREALTPNTENKRSALGHPQVRAENLLKRLCASPQAAEVELAFEVFEGFADDGLNGGYFIVGQLLKLAFASLAA